jgi:hypothetical protein
MSSEPRPVFLYVSRGKNILQKISAINLARENIQAQKLLVTTSK